MGSQGTEPGGGFGTRAIHAGQPCDPSTGAVIIPVSLSTTFAQGGAGSELGQGSAAGFDYSRSGNPTRQALEGLHRVARDQSASSLIRSNADSIFFVFQFLSDEWMHSHGMMAAAEEDDVSDPLLQQCVGSMTLPSVHTVSGSVSIRHALSS